MEIETQIVEQTEKEEKQERAALRRDLDRQEADDARRWEGIEFTGESPDPARTRKCAEEREEYIKRRDEWVEWVVGPIHSKKKTKAEKERLEAERERG